MPFAYKQLVFVGLPTQKNRFCSERQGFSSLKLQAVGPRKSFQIGVIELRLSTCAYQAVLMHILPLEPSSCSTFFRCDYVVELEEVIFESNADEVELVSVQATIKLLP
jgi:hypothetical protein